MPRLVVLFSFAVGAMLECAIDRCRGKKASRTVVRGKGCRTRTILLVTTLIDGEAHTKQDLADSFALRWHCELNPRSLEQVPRMRRLWCMTPEMGGQELWTHLLAYNLVRVRMAGAAAVHHRPSTLLKFKAAKTHVHSLAAPLKKDSFADRHRLEAELLQAIASCRVGERPGMKRTARRQEMATETLIPYKTKSKGPFRTYGLNSCHWSLPRSAH